MSSVTKYDRLILAMDDAELEKFVFDWVNSKTSAYPFSARFSGSGDLGRDVVGFLSAEKHEGNWHNYQCKQYGRKLPTDTAISEIGKILFYAEQGEFIPPAGYFFVVPRGVNRNLETLIFNPNKFKTKLIDEWNQRWGQTIIDDQCVLLTPSLKKMIEEYDFSRIRRLNLDDILLDDAIKPVLFRWFDEDPGPVDLELPPVDVQAQESFYINQLLEAYGEKELRTFANYNEILGYTDHANHLKTQRERFYAAESFKRFYRDNTSPKILTDLEDDVYYGVIDVCNSAHESSLVRLEKVMNQAASLSLSGALSKYTRIPVKQGICHHHANLEVPKLKWKK